MVVKSTYEKLEKCYDSNECKEVSNRGHNGTEFRPGAHHWAQEERDKEECQQDGGIPHDRPNGDDSDSDEGARWLVTLAIREGLDKHIPNNE